MIEYELQGMTESNMQILQAELRSLIEPAFHDKNARIIVTPGFTATVRSFEPEESGEEYNPVHEYGTAFAKTIPLVRDDNLSFVIIFDARIFADLREQTVADRYAIVLHELVHVKNGLLKFASIGKDPFIRRPEKKWEILLENSWVI
jgi:hypothetical protein